MACRPFLLSSDFTRGPLPGRLETPQQALDHGPNGRAYERCVTMGRKLTSIDERSATLLVRVWVEGGTDNFRGRLATVDTSLAQGGDVEVSFAVTSSPDATVEAVRSWLDAFLVRAPHPSSDAP
jgi:hypothetical protein